MSDQHKVPIFRARDFWLAATLVAMGMQVVRVEVRARQPHDPPGPPWATFVLADSPDRPQLVQDYTADRLLVSPRKLHAAFRYCQELRSTAADAGREGA